MRHFAKRAAALGVALVMTLTTALASEALGHELRGGVTPLSVGTSLTNNIFWSDTYSDKRNERYTTYIPNQDVTPTVAYGTKVLSRATLTSMAKDLEAQGQRVVSGINGDYYVLATGAPLGMVVTDGVLRSSASYLHALGFLPDGSAIIGTPNLDLKADFKGYSLKIADINKIRTNTGFYLFTDDFTD